MPSIVMSGDYKRKVSFKPAPDAKSFVCGLCVAHGYYGIDQPTTTERGVSHLKRPDHDPNTVGIRQVGGVYPYSKCVHYDTCSVNVCPLGSDDFDILPDDPETGCKLSKTELKGVLDEKPCEVCGKVCNKPKFPATPTKDLKAWRKIHGLTQTRLGELLGVSQQMVAMVEKNEKAMPIHWGPLLLKIQPTHT